MARTKSNCRKKGNHSAANMLKALRLHRGGASIRTAAKECNIAYPTLRRYVVKNLNVPIESLMSTRLIPNYDNQKVFTPEQEDSLREYFIECALKFYGLTAKDCRSVAYQMATINNISVPESWKREKIAGKEWLRSFRTRHPDLSLKKPEGCSLARATSFNKESVKLFFNNLKRAIDRHPSFGDGCRVFNLDETATTTVQRPQKIVAPKGKHNISKVTSGEKGTLVTTCAIVCASGQALPPVLVFPRKNFKDIMMTGAPPGALGLAQQSGWMTADLFVNVMKHFIKHTSASPENPALLILDNHESHLSLEALNLAKSSGVIILTLHPHTTAKMQPLDVGLNGPFKVFYNSAVDSWMMRNPGRPMTIYNVAECVGIAYAKAMTPINITASFRKCGIFPYNPDVFTEIDFLPSDVTNQPEPQCLNAVVDRQDDKTPSLDSDDDVVSRGSGSPSLLATIASENAIEMESRVLEPVPSTPIADSVIKQSFVSPKEFMPALKAGPRTSNRKNRKRGKSMIATDTPEKNRIEEDTKQRKQKKAQVQKVKRPVMTEKVNLPKKKKSKIVVEESSTEEELEMVPELSETEISEVNDSDDDELVVIRGNFEKLSRKPNLGDYVLVLFIKKNNIYYIAKVVEVISASKYGVSYMRMKDKANMKFYMPLEPDLAEIDLKDIKMILPPPKVNGTKNRSSTYNFPVRVAPTIHIR